MRVLDVDILNMRKSISSARQKSAEQAHVDGDTVRVDAEGSRSVVRARGGKGGRRRDRNLVRSIVTGRRTVPVNLPKIQATGDVSTKTTYRDGSTALNEYLASVCTVDGQDRSHELEE